MALLNRFLRLLKLLEQVAEFANVLTESTGLAIIICLFSYEALLLYSCDAHSSAILASAIGLTLHCVLNQPDK